MHRVATKTVISKNKSKWNSKAKKILSCYLCLTFQFQFWSVASIITLLVSIRTQLVVGHNAQLVIDPNFEFSHNSQRRHCDQILSWGVMTKVDVASKLKIESYDQVGSCGQHGFINGVGNRIIIWASASFGVVIIWALWSNFELEL